MFSSILNVIFYEKRNVVIFEDNTGGQSDMAFPVSVHSTHSMYRAMIIRMKYFSLK